MTLEVLAKDEIQQFKMELLESIETLIQGHEKG